MTADQCDFGTPDDPPIRWRYPCRNFTLTDTHDVEHVSIGSWFACDACSELVEVGDYDTLIARVLDRSEQRYAHLGPADRAQLRLVARAHLEPWYAAFREHRDGPRELITEQHRQDADALFDELREDD